MKKVIEVTEGGAEVGSSPSWVSTLRAERLELPTF